MTMLANGFGAYADLQYFDGLVGRDRAQPVYRQQTCLNLFLFPMIPDKPDRIALFRFLDFDGKAQHLHGGLVRKQGDRAALEQALDANADEGHPGQFHHVDLDAAMENGHHGKLVILR